MTSPQRLAAAFLGTTLALAPACRTSETRHEDEVLSDVRHGRYAEALARARQLAQERPGDEGTQTLARDAEVAYLLDQGRSAVFVGELERALERFEAAEEIAPGHPVVARWIAKTRTQLATRWLDRAAELQGPEHLHEAELAYERVLQYDPDNADAIDGLAHALLLQNYRAGMSKTYFDDGLSSFRELLLEQARRAFQVSRHYKENEPAVNRGEQVEGMMAEERLAQAKELEATGQFFAARNEYRLVLLIDPLHAEARAGLDRMDREVRATRTLAEADMALRRGALAKAEEKLEHASVLTEAQTDNVSLLKSHVEERRLDDMYEEARSLAEDYRYPEAVVAYDELLAVAPDFRDARLRKETLEEFIDLTEEFYAKAVAAQDDAVAEEYLRAIHPVIWPEYKDVVERLAAIEARKAARAAAEPGGAPAPDQPEDG